MLIPCPQCQHGLKLKEAKPGRFKIQCPKCAARLLLNVPADPRQPPTVSAMAPEPAAAPPSRPEPRGDVAVAPSQEATLPATIDWPTAPPAAGHQTSAPGGRPGASGIDTLPPTQPAPPSGAGAGAGAGAETVARPPAGGSLGQSTVGSDPHATSAPDAYAATPPTQVDIPTALGGYQILEELGRGGMGAVYLARQLSLDRKVALKVMRPEWAGDPRFVARFTREAYAAAQLVHHNVVQIYDFGEDKGANYFSMEYVPGQNLSGLIKREGTIEPRVAVGYMLQAARGLKFAHDRGMIHRDIKPDNLMLNDQGIVKVADLGLVKTPGGDGPAEGTDLLKGRAPVQGSLAAREAAQARDTGGLTRADVAMGTPAYMPPEQAADAAHVDQRADIYALGCTLYALVTGRPPFQGKTVYELMTKHATEPVVPPEVVVRRVPKALSAIILKMVAKKPEDRYADLGLVIRAFEDFLGVAGSGPFTPRAEHAELLEAAVGEYNAVPLARLRPKVLLGFYASCVLLALLCALLRQPVLAGGLVGLAVLSALASFVVDGITRKTHLFLKVRELVFGSSLIDWLTALAGLTLLVVLLVVFHLLWAWLAFCGAAVLLAVSLHVLVDRGIVAGRRGPLDRVEAMLKDLRLHGLEEDALRQFVCTYSGQRWEEFYEALFGYEAKLVARGRWGAGERGRARPKWGAWREPLLRGIEAKRAARREAREQKLLEAIEEKNLQAQGVNLVTARRKAKRSAEAMVSRAAELKEETLRASVAAAPTLSPEELRRKRASRSMDAAAEKPDDFLVQVGSGRNEPRGGGPLDLILGPRPRFLAGALLLAGFLAWAHQNEVFSAQEIKDLATEAVNSQDASKLKEARKLIKLPAAKATKPLAVPLVPPAVTGLFRDYNAGVAGLILLLSSFFRGWKMSLCVVLAAALALFGRTAGIPPIRLPLLGTIRPTDSSLSLSVVLASLGLFFGRSRR